MFNISDWLNKFRSNFINREEKKYMYEDIIQKYADAHRLDPILIRALIQQESSFKEKAYRFEPEFYNRYIKNNPIYRNRLYYDQPKVISASYGLCQVMYTTFEEMGYSPKNPEELYDPDLNIKYGCKLLANKIKKYGEILGILAYNSGSTKSNNPRKEANFNYLKSIAKHYKAFGGNNQKILDFIEV